MYEILSQLNVLLQVDAIKSDNFMLRLHYIASVIILVTYSVVVTLASYVGDPIDCRTSHRDAPNQGFLDSYCYIHGTRPLRWGIDSVSRPGKAFDVNCNGEQCDKTHKYYQWVAVVTLLQAGLFYLPRYLWYGWEGGRMAQLIGTLAQQPKFYLDSEQEETSVLLASGEFRLSSSGCKRTEELARQYVGWLGENKLYVIKFTAIEILSLIIVYLQFYITDSFLDGALSTHGLSLVNDLLKVESDRTDRLEWALPVLSRCEFTQYGTGGSKVHIHSICVLPNNVVHQKFYVFWGIWMLLVILYTTLHMVFKLGLLVVPAFRAFIATTVWGDSETCSTSQSVLTYILQNIRFSDWHVLEKIHENLAAYNFMLFEEDLAFVYFQQNKEKTEFIEFLISQNIKMLPFPPEL